jgi:hypothetical protein
MASDARLSLTQVRLRTARWETLILLGLALVGYWGPWLIHPSAALTLNGYELSEWATFLPQVRDGSLPLAAVSLPWPGGGALSIYFARLVFFIPLACVAGLLSLGASRFRGRPSAYLKAWWSDLLPHSWLSWLLLGLAGVCCFLVFPPYPAYVFPDYWPEYQPQFLSACLTAILILAVFFLPGEVKDVVQIVLALIGGGFGLWSFLVLHPVAIALLGPGWVRWGWGWVAMLAGLAGLAWLGLTHLFGQKD